MEKACRLIREAGKKGAKLVVFPEAWVSTFPHWPRALPLGERELSQEAWVKLYEESVAGTGFDPLQYTAISERPGRDLGKKA